MPRKKVGDPDAEILTELAAIKRLMILLLVKAGASQEEVSIALQVDRSVVSRMLPARRVKSFKFAN